MVVRRLATLVQPGQGLVNARTVDVRVRCSVRARLPEDVHPVVDVRVRHPLHHLPDPPAQRVVLVARHLGPVTRHPRQLPPRVPLVTPTLPALDPARQEAGAIVRVARGRSPHLELVLVPTHVPARVPRLHHRLVGPRRHRDERLEHVRREQPRRLTVHPDLGRLVRGPLEEVRAASLGGHQPVPRVVRVAGQHPLTLLREPVPHRVVRPVRPRSFRHRRGSQPVQHVVTVRLLDPVHDLRDAVEARVVPVPSRARRRRPQPRRDRLQTQRLIVPVARRDTIRQAQGAAPPARIVPKPDLPRRARDPGQPPGSVVRVARDRGARKRHLPPQPSRRRRVRDRRPVPSARLRQHQPRRVVRPLQRVRPVRRRGQAPRPVVPVALRRAAVRVAPPLETPRQVVGVARHQVPPVREPNQPTQSIVRVAVSSPHRVLDADNAVNRVVLEPRHVPLRVRQRDEPRHPVVVQDDHPRGRVLNRTEASPRAFPRCCRRTPSAAHPARSTPSASPWRRARTSTCSPTGRSPTSCPLSGCSRTVSSRPPEASRRSPTPGSCTPRSWSGPSRR